MEGRWAVATFQLGSACMWGSFYIRSPVPIGRVPTYGWMMGCCCIPARLGWCVGIFLYPCSRPCRVSAGMCSLVFRSWQSSWSVYTGGRDSLNNLNNTPSLSREACTRPYSDHHRSASFSGTPSHLRFSAILWNRSFSLPPLPCARERVVGGHPITIARYRSISSLPILAPLGPLSWAPIPLKERPCASSVL